MFSILLLELPLPKDSKADASYFWKITNHVRCPCRHHAVCPSRAARHQCHMDGAPSVFYALRDAILARAARNLSFTRCATPMSPVCHMHRALSVFYALRDAILTCAARNLSSTRCATPMSPVCHMHRAPSVFHALRDANITCMSHA